MLMNPCRFQFRIYNLFNQCSKLPHFQKKKKLKILSIYNINSASQVHMQGSYSLFNDDLKVIHLAPNYHSQPLSSCSYPILCANILPVAFDIEEISMFIGVARVYADPIHGALVSYI